MTDWTRGCPVVTVPLGPPKAVTLIWPYYECPQFFQTQLDGLRAVPVDVAHHLRVIVVDDGSPRCPLRLDTTGVPCPVQAFRITRDVPWNWLAARNLGAHHAPDGWLLLTDMDHVAPPETLRSVVYGQHDSRVIYVFSRREHTGAAIFPHSASFLLTRELFWRIGGYDETLSGHYGTDGDFRRRCRAVAPFQVLTDVLVRHEFVADSSTTTYVRKDPADAAAVARLVAARRPGWRPRVLSFPYEVIR